MKPAVALALGDPTGIGPELCLRTALSPEVRSICRPVLFGGPEGLAAQAAAARITAPIREVASALEASEAPVIHLVPLDQFPRGAPPIGTISDATGRAALGSAAAAIRAALSGEVAAVVAAPQNQAAIQAAGISFDGYPRFVAEQCGLPPEDVFLMLCFDATRIVHVTLHVPVRRALDLLTRARVARAILAADSALRRLGVAAPRIAVGGLNPHAGEGGLFGSEDDEVTAPAIAEARAAGVDAEGPFGTDTMFQRRGYDAFVVMLHDQGHIAAKMVAAHRTAGLSIGAPVLFSSVAHGTGHDIAGQGKADPAAMIEAVRRVCGAA